MEDGFFDDAYAFLIGVGNYKSEKVKNLLAPPSDVKNFTNVLTHNCGFKKVLSLVDENATADNIIKSLEKIKSCSSPNSVVYIYFSGHGADFRDLASKGYIEWNQGSAPIYHLLPYDFDPSNPSKTSISGKYLKEMVTSMQSKKILVLFDACHSYGAVEGKDPFEKIKGKNPDGETLKSFSKREGIVFIASSREDQVSWESGKSYFTQTVVNALQGAASGNDGAVRLFEFCCYLFNEVPMIVKKNVNQNQNPVMCCEKISQNFVISWPNQSKGIMAPEDRIWADDEITTNFATIMDKGLDQIGVYTKGKLNSLICEKYVLHDLHTLCQKIDIDYYNLGGENALNDKAAKIVERVWRENKIEKFVEEVKKK